MSGTGIGGGRGDKMKMSMTAAAVQRRDTSFFSKFRWFSSFVSPSTRNLMKRSTFDEESDVSKIDPSHVKASCTRLQRLVRQMRTCITHLNEKACDAKTQDCDELVTDAQLEEWAILIYESMSAPSRTFHSVQHVFDISSGADSVQTLAAFFHDAIYYSIDGGLSATQAEYLKGIIAESEDKQAVSLLPNSEDFDEQISIVMDIFGFEAGQTLNPFKGLNEFLSAALAVRCLGNVLNLTHLAQVVACIEATVPFRADDAKGLGPMNHLYERLKKTNTKFNLNFSEEDLVKTIQRAANLANRDVDNFSWTNTAKFLSNTWNLLPESNVSLRKTKFFRISDYTMALKKMTGFFSSLNPDVIYVSFHDEPSNSQLDILTNRARVNIKVALKYMQCKLLSICVLAALAQLTGGDAPIALFLGDLPERHYSSPSVEDIIRPLITNQRNSRAAQNTENGPSLKIDEAVYSILCEGRSDESEFDIKNSPLAAYLYGLMGDIGLDASLQHVVYPMDAEHSTELLDSLPKQAVREIAKACAMIAITRKSSLMDIVEKYEG